MKHAVLTLLAILVTVPAAWGRPPESSASAAWTGAPEQKLWGLMTVWAEAKYTFPWFDERPDLDWDAAVQEAIPRVLAAEDLESYYDLLAELVTKLDDSHTSVLPPWGHFRPGFDYPPVEIRVIGGAFLVVGTGDTEEIERERVYPGLEILEIGDGVPVRDHFEANVLRLRTQGSRQADEALLPFYLLYGPEGEPVRLKVRDPDGTVRAVALTRASGDRNGAPFMPRFLSNMMAPAITSRLLDDGLLFVSIPTFENPDLAGQFLDLIDGMDPSAIRGMILDLRNNMGGSSATGNAMVSGLIEEPVTSPLMTYRQFSGAEQAWGREPHWTTTHTEIAPREGRRYLGPLVVLTDAITHSSAEDFVIELQTGERARVVGERTAGGAGNGLSSPLPGGGTFTVSTFRATYPDGKEYVGLGIEPDLEVAPTRRDILNGTDPVLERAAALLRDR